MNPYENDNPPITPAQLNRQLTIARFALAILTLLIITACFIQSNKYKEIENNYNYQTGEKPIDVTPPADNIGIGLNLNGDEELKKWMNRTATQNF